MDKLQHAFPSGWQARSMQENVLRLALVEKRDVVLRTSTGGGKSGAVLAAAKMDAGPVVMVACFTLQMDDAEAGAKRFNLRVLRIDGKAMDGRRELAAQAMSSLRSGVADFDLVLIMAAQLCGFLPQLY